VFIIIIIIINYTHHLLVYADDVNTWAEGNILWR